MCNCTSTILSSTASTAVSGSLLLITPTKALSPDNEQGIKLLINSSTPATGAALPVAVQLNGSAVSVYDKFGNIVYGNQIYNGQILKGYFGNNGASSTSHLQLIRLPKRYYYGGNYEA